MKPKIAISVILGLILIGGLFYRINQDPNVYDAQIVVQISGTESKHFDFNIKEYRDVASKITQYLRISENETFDDNYPSLHGTGKKPNRALFRSRAEDKETGKITIRRTNGGFSVIYSESGNVMDQDQPLDRAVLSCCGAIWNTMNIEIVK